jgi:hypothetical protein
LERRHTLAMIGPETMAISIDEWRGARPEIQSLRYPSKIQFVSLGI